MEIQPLKEMSLKGSENIPDSPLLLSSSLSRSSLRQGRLVNVVPSTAAQSGRAGNKAGSQERNRELKTEAASFPTSFNMLLSIVNSVLHIKTQFFPS